MTKERLTELFTAWANDFIVNSTDYTELPTTGTEAEVYGKQAAQHLLALDKEV